MWPVPTSCLSVLDIPGTQVVAGIACAVTPQVLCRISGTNKVQQLRHRFDRFSQSGSPFLANITAPDIQNFQARRMPQPSRQRNTSLVPQLSAAVSVKHLQML